MQSPWKKLKPSQPYVLSGDRIYVNTFNQRVATYNAARTAGQQQLTRVNTALYPQVFAGKFDAPIVLLLQNPRADGHAANIDAPPIRRIAENNRGVARCHLCLSIGDPWWRKVFDRGVTEVATILHLNPSTVWSRLADRLLSIEYFPYWSKTFGQAVLRLPSQQFSFDLVKRAIRRNATIMSFPRNFVFQEVGYKPD